MGGKMDWGEDSPIIGTFIVFGFGRGRTRCLQYLRFWVALDCAEDRNLELSRVPSSSPSSFLCPFFEKYVWWSLVGRAERVSEWVTGGGGILNFFFGEEMREEFWWEKKPYGLKKNKGVQFQYLLSSGVGIRMHRVRITHSAPCPPPSKFNRGLNWYTAFFCAVFCIADRWSIGVGEPVPHLLKHIF